MGGVATILPSAGRDRHDTAIKGAGADMFADMFTEFSATMMCTAPRARAKFRRRHLWLSSWSYTTRVRMVQYG